jgi:fumarate reductase flavoprotein subunit
VETRIFVNKEGNRFVNEGGRRDDMTRALFEQPDNLSGSSWTPTPIPPAMRRTTSTKPPTSWWPRAAPSRRHPRGAGRADRRFRRKPGGRGGRLQRHAATGEADQFGRTLYSTPIDNGPFYAAARVPTVHHTMGGVRINEYAQVIDENAT